MFRLFDVKKAQRGYQQKAHLPCPSSALQFWRQYATDQRKQTTLEKELEQAKEKQKDDILQRCFREWRQIIKHDVEVRELRKVHHSQCRIFTIPNAAILCDAHATEA